MYSKTVDLKSHSKNFLEKQTLKSARYFEIVELYTTEIKIDCPKTKG